MKETLLTVALAILTAAVFAADGEKKNTTVTKTGTEKHSEEKASAKGDADKTTDTAGKPTDPSSKSADQTNDSANKLRESVDRSLEKTPASKDSPPKKR